MNREAMMRILKRTRAVGAVALADPPTPATRATSGYSKDPVGSLTDLLLPRPTSFPPDPQGRLWALLDTWASMDEATWAEANVKALHDDIMDLFRDHPEAEAWYRDWRAAHPEARLC